MLSVIREKFGPLLVGGIIGFITFVFIFSGVFSPKATRGMHEGSVAGTVNGDAITLQEFGRELNRRTEFFKQIAGGKISDAQMRQFKIKDSVFNEIVNRRLMIQAADQAGLFPSDEEMRAKIREIPAFQKDGKFDPLAYRNVLSANQYTPSSFERSVREDLALQAWGKFFKGRSKVSNEELKREYLQARNKRDLTYVLLTHEVGKKLVPVAEEEIKKFAADATKQAVIKSYFDAHKERDFKGLVLETPGLKERIARDVLASEKSTQAKAAMDALADKVVTAMNALPGGATADATKNPQIQALLKDVGLQVKKSGMLTQASPYLPGVGEAKDALKDAFAVVNADQLKAAPAKKYAVLSGVLIARPSAIETADLAGLEKERASLAENLVMKKEREMEASVLKSLKDKAKIERNEEVLADSPEEDEEAPPVEAPAAPAPTQQKKSG